MEDCLTQNLSQLKYDGLPFQGYIAPFLLWGSFSAFVFQPPFAYVPSPWPVQGPCGLLLEAVLDGQKNLPLKVAVLVPNQLEEVS